MKKNKFLWTLALSSTCLFALASCQGAKGEKGDQGNPGINGTNGTDGKNGENGKDGSSVLTGKGEPASTLGNDGDSYIDSLTFDFYSKENGTWSKVGNIKGNTGSQGNDGESGTSVRTGNGEPASTLGNDGDSYIDLSTFDFYVKANGEWFKEGNLKGEKGDKGDKGQNGSSGTPGSKGEDGKDGETAYSNVILHSNYGYITPSAGSVVANGTNEISFTVHQTDYNAHRLTGLTLKNSAFDGGSKTISIDSNEEGFKVAKDVSTNDYTFTTIMKEGGFVVSGIFSGKNKTVSIPTIEASNGTISDLAGSNLSYFEDDTVTLKFTFESGKTLNTCKVNGEDVSIDDLTYVSNDGGYYTYTATVGEKGVIVSNVTYTNAYNFTAQTFGGITVTADKSIYKDGDDVTLRFSYNSSTYTIDQVTVNGSIVSLTNNKYIIENVSQAITVDVKYSSIATLNYRKDNSGFVAVTGLATGSTGTAVNIKNRYDDDDIMGNVEQIDKDAFKNTSINSVYIPSNMKTINESAFNGCSQLSKVTIETNGNDLIIGEYAFQNCTSLTEIKIPNRVTSSDTNKAKLSKTFYGCTNLKTVIIGDGVSSIDNQTFYGCTSLEWVVLGSSIRTIVGDAFTTTTSSKGGNLKLFYHGTKTAEGYPPFSNADTNHVASDDVYYYYEKESEVPSDGGKYWHYDESTGEPTVWKDSD